MRATASDLPAHDIVDGWTRRIEICALIAAGTLLLANIHHIVAAALWWHWWSPLVLVAATLAADLVSGLAHWTADTWFSETMPFLGRRVLRPFRVHHVNPHDFLRRDAVDCNGDVAMLNVPILLVALLLPEAGTSGAMSFALTAFASISLPTNQVHQWAHMPSPPSFVRWLQRHGFILGIEAHAEHHRDPHVTNYCIATGWCNRWLTATGFFPTCERLITHVTGLQPRVDERAFVDRW